MSTGWIDANIEENGFQELSGQEAAAGRESGLRVGHLFGQDRNADSESHDGLAHVVRRETIRIGHHLRPIR